MTTVRRAIAALALLGCAGVVAAARPQDRGAFEPTKVIRFSVMADRVDRPDRIDAGGSCSSPSRAAWFRSDALACTTENASFDPCFTTAREGLVICVTDPRTASGRIALQLAAKPTRRAASPSPIHRAWFFELTDGATCRPLQAPGREVEGLPELYECRSVDGLPEIALGELDSTNPVWSISKAKINKMLLQTIKWTASMAVKTVWQ